MLGPRSAANEPAFTSMGVAPLLHWPWAAQTVGLPHRAKSASQRCTVRLSREPSAVSLITTFSIVVCELPMAVPGGRKTPTLLVPSLMNGEHPMQRIVLTNVFEVLL